MNDRHYVEEVQFSVMFCNDVRLERDGQVTYVGVYQPHLTVKEFPYTFRTFTAVLTVLAPLEIAGQPITFRVLKNKRAIMEFSPSPGDFPAGDKHDLRVSINMATEALEIKEATRFSGELSIGDKVYRSRNVLVVNTEPMIGKTIEGRGKRPMLSK